MLRRLFEPFTLKPWHSAKDPIQESPENWLFWRTGANVPPRLVLVDAPDIDSDVTVNWGRARAIRQTGRRAGRRAHAAKIQRRRSEGILFAPRLTPTSRIIIAFNFCDLVADRDFLAPVACTVLRRDRRAA